MLIRNRFEQEQEAERAKEKWKSWFASIESNLSGGFSQYPQFEDIARAFPYRTYEELYELFEEFLSALNANSFYGVQVEDWLRWRNSPYSQSDEVAF